MTYLEALQWLADQDYNTLLIPGWMIEHCSKASDYVPLTVEIENEKRSPRDGQFFIEVAENRKGDVTPWIYEYPRPSSMTTDISLAVDGPSALPPERCVDNVLADHDGYYEAPYVAGALRVKRVTVSPVTGFVFSVEPEPVQ